MKYTLGISGWVQVDVEADTPEQAIEKALTETAAGELYDFNVEEVTDDAGKSVGWDYDKVKV